MAVQLDRATLEAAFERMGRLASERGKVIDIAIFGGSCLVLASDIRLATRDVDAVFLSHPELAYELGDIVARELALPGDWLNQAVRSYAFARGNPDPELLPLGEYPKHGIVGLRAFVPTPRFLLAMKLIANRDSGDDEARDLADIVALMAVTGLTDAASLATLVAACYPAAVGIGPRMEARLVDVVDRYQRTSRNSGHAVPTWHVGGGDPTRAR
jgi:hypothetical protein